MILPRLGLTALAVSLCVPAVAAGAETDTPSVPQAESWRNDRPKVGDPRPPELPKFEKTVLPNGLTLYVAVEDELPLVSYRLVVRGGSSQDPKGKAGLTSLMFSMLQEGAGDLDALAFSDRVADLGASFGSGSARDEGSAGITGLARNGEAMLGLLADAVMRPRMSQKDFDRLKAKTMADQIRQRGSPAGLAMEHFPRVVYGPEHPYGHPASGTVETVGELTLADVEAQYDRLFAPGNAALIVAGDVDFETTKKLAEATFGAWPEREVALTPVPALEPTRRARIVVINKAPAPQTFTMLGRPLFEKGHPDEVRVRLANAVFGGTFAARLNMNLREDKGYTYGAHSAVAFRTGTGVMLAYAALRQDVTVEGLEEFIKELKGLAKRPPTPEEVEDAKASRVKTLTAQFEGIGAITGAATGLFVYGLPLDYFAQLPKRYTEATLAQVRDAATEYFKAPLMQILMVGDANAIGKELRAARLGKIEVIEPPTP